jgi:polyhydroxybutyrate depolymerase
MTTAMLRFCFVTLAVSALSATSCRRSLPSEDCLTNPPTEAGQSVCTVPGFDDRDFILHVPKAFDGKTPLPVIFALHGGGGRKEGFGPITCPEGDETNANCLTNVANERGFVLVYPDGTESSLNLRTWGASEKKAGFQCVHACEENVDDIAYLKTLMDHVAKLVPVDPKRIFVTGFSNGGEMTYRVACELSDRVAAVAPVGGGNMIALTGTCAPSRPTPLLHIHGKSDPCYPLEGGVGTCPGQPEGQYASVIESVIGTTDKPGWAIRNGCSPDMPEVVALPDDASDGTTAEKQTFTQCQAPVQFVTVTNGGHTWPGGDQYLGADTVGLVSKDFSASEMILDFFTANPLP